MIEPHLSLGFGRDATLSPIAELVAPLTPVRAMVKAVTILVGPHENMKAGPSFSLGR